MCFSNTFQVVNNFQIKTMEPNSNHDDKNIKTIESNSFNHYDKTYVQNIRNLFLKNPEDFRKTHITHNSFEENSINLDEKYNKTDLNNNKNELISQNFIQNSGNHDLNLSNISEDFRNLSDKNFKINKCNKIDIELSNELVSQNLVFNNNKNELVSQNFIQNSGNHDLNLSNSSGDFEILSDKNFETKKLKNKNKDIIIIFIIIFAVPVTIIFISAYNMLKKKKKNKNNLKNEKFSIIINV